MDRHLAPPISGSWSPGAARAVDGASLLRGPLRVDRNAETEKKMNGWTKGRGTKHQGTVHNIYKYNVKNAFHMKNLGIEIKMNPFHYVFICVIFFVFIFIFSFMQLFLFPLSVILFASLKNSTHSQLNVRYS
jgi:hypothetical protein